MPHQHPENLAGEHRSGDMGQLIIFLIFMAVWIADMFAGFSDFLSSYIPLAVELPVGIILLLLGLYLARTGLNIVFNKEAPPEGVVRRGPFGFVRHPIYLSEIIMYLGLLIIHLSLAAVAVWIIGIAFLHYISRHEEKLLLAKHGEAYRQYMREVGMWLPRPGGSK